MAHSYFFKRPSQGLPCLRKSVTVSFSQTWLDQKLQLPSSQLSHSTPILSLPIPSPISILIKLILKMDVVENELTDSGLSEYPSIGWTSPNTSQLQFYYGKNWWMWIDDPTWHVIIVKAEKTNELYLITQRKVWWVKLEDLDHVWRRGGGRGGPSCYWPEQVDLFMLTDSLIDIKLGT